MTKEEREFLLKKVTKPIKSSSTESHNIIKELYETDNEPNIIKYHSKKISFILDKYSFPEKYNYLEAVNCPSVIKDQKNCGACWSFSSTTALSYRFYKKGISIDLSPQYPLSCFHRNCDDGESLKNAYLNLNKNGTVIEECFPYSSANGTTIEKCPNRCKDGTKLKKYYSKNIYTTDNDYSKENYYDIITIIIDQLINYGPVAARIDTYEDFFSFGLEPDCGNNIYSYDGISKEVGDHGVVIIGYGYEDEKYYWLVQNSWGEQSCNGGFFKIEFGQIGIERITFSEPVISDDGDYNEIEMKIHVSETCELSILNKKILYGKDSNDSFEISFKNNRDTFYYQCGKVSLFNETNYKCYSTNFYPKKKCTYEIDYLETLEGFTYYEYNTSAKFNYYGIDLIYPFFSRTNFYVSEGGSRILLLHYPYGEKSIFTYIYANLASYPYPLNGCHRISTNEFEFNLISCEIQSDELYYLPSYSSYFSNDDKYLMYYTSLCGIKESIDTKIFWLDKKKYPVFRVKEFIIPNVKEIGSNSTFSLIANIKVI